MNKVNNGYVFLLHYLNLQENPRVFGPFSTPNAALHNARHEMQLDVQCDRPERPVINRRYPVIQTPETPKEDRITYLTIQTLETPKLFNKGFW